MKKNIFLVGALALVLAACGNSDKKPAEEKAEAPAAEGKAEEATEKTGTATAAGYGGDIKLTVTMEGDKIKDIVVDEHKESEGIGADALPKLVEEAKKANSAEIENVSGATVTSEAFKAALKDAMEAAK
ncbi:FMN-binding protein [uncultured Anaerococcus sp.]|uniref:FMN-binding protein n=1 Tax=uncultured Anaerococcus sp. TaxID=293428 RepID=UPI0028049731|nr:FMN-binding protein [uncultured Anaerococcus sp.]